MAGATPSAVAIDAGPACRLPFPGDPCMTLSDLRPARRALPFALALACASIALPAAAQGLQTSFEPGQPAPAAGDGALQVRIGTGPVAPYAAQPGVGYSGLHALQYASAGGHARRQLVTTDLAIAADTTLSSPRLPDNRGKDPGA